MIKKMRKNKKGFTLIEIIVVLVIMGILLAIAVPAILGYVGKANDAKYLAQARGGYLAAQTITAENASRAAGGTVSKPNITVDTVNAELGMKGKTDEEGYVNAITCTLNTGNISVKSCDVTVKGMPSGKTVRFADGKAEVVDVTPAP